jgi:methylthioribulose-1-phosphate dehydratase
MSAGFDVQAPRDALAAIAADFHGRGWMAGTAGNLSARVDAGSFWITASGRPKGRLDAEDFVRVAIADGAVIDPPADPPRPSAETSIHCALYRLFPTARACLHVHTVDACIAADNAAAEAEVLRLPAIEMLKGLAIRSAAPDVGLPLFVNHADVAIRGAAAGGDGADDPRPWRDGVGRQSATGVRPPRGGGISAAIYRARQRGRAWIN